MFRNLVKSLNNSLISNYLKPKYCNNIRYYSNAVISITDVPLSELKLTDQQNHLLSNINDISNKYSSLISKEELDRLKQFENDCYMNESLSQFHLGVFYSQGLIKDNKENFDTLSLSYFKEAADNNLAQGQYAYAMSLLLGSCKNVFKPILPTLDKVNAQSVNSDENMILGSGWVSNDKADKNFNYRKWLKSELLVNRAQKDNRLKEQLEEQERKAEAIRNLNISSIQEYSDAQFSLGMILLYGKYDIKENKKLGLQWLKKASENGNLDALFELGKYHYNQFTLFQSTTDEVLDNTFIHYFIEASNKGHGESSYWLGTHLISSEEPLKGIEYFKKSIEQGNGPASTFLSMLYRDGIYVEQDINLFNKYLQIGAERKDSAALLILGECYLTGIQGFDVNYKKAFQHLTESSQLCNSDAYLHLGVMYYNGYGVDQSFENAFYSYQKAFQYDMNNQLAISNLYSMHKDGIGIPKSNEMATFYKNLLNTEYQIDVSDEQERITK